MLTAEAGPVIKLRLQDPMKFYEKEGALFRVRSTYPTAPVDDVWDARNARWVRYEGDCLKPIVFGNPVSEAELPPAAREKPD